MACLQSLYFSQSSRPVQFTMSTVDLMAGDDVVIEVGSTSWKSEGNYDEYGEPICICCPGPEEGLDSPAPSPSPSPVHPEWIPLDEAYVEPSLDDRIRLYESEREARHIVYSKWCLEAFIELASYSLHTDEAGRAAFRRLPNYEIVAATVNGVLARDYQGTGDPPRML